MSIKPFQRRYILQGRLELKTGLHIGGGDELLSASQSPVLRAADGRPYIPGSSFKGALRSTVEKLVPAIGNGLRSCALTAGQGCPGPEGPEQRAFNDRRRNEGWDDATLLNRLGQGIELQVDGKRSLVRLCATCWLFGSPYTAARLSVADLSVPDDIEPVIQVRDGVAIDRDSEKQIERRLYNYEVVAPNLELGLEITLEDPTDSDLGLVCLGLSEFASGLGSLGGKRSRGLGRCQIAGLEIYALDLTIDDLSERAKRLRRYLLHTALDQKMERVSPDPHTFMQQQIEALLA